MDGFASVIIFLIFLAVTFSRKSLQTKNQAAQKPIIPIRKKDPWAPDDFVASSNKPISMIPKKMPDEPTTHVDRIPSEDSFWSTNETDSYDYDRTFTSLESINFSDDTPGVEVESNSNKPVSQKGLQKSSYIFPDLTPDTLVQAVVMREVLDKL